MTKSSNNKIFINGPFNYTKLENNSGKIVHVFFDIHMPIQLQSECDSDDAVNIDKYLSKFFKTTEKNIDFFFEIHPYEKKDEREYNKIYILKLYDLFLSNKNKYGENIKFHYIDIRRFFYYNNIMENIRNASDIFFYYFFHNDISKDFKINKIQEFMYLLNNINDYLYQILDIYDTLLKKNVPYEKVNLENLIFENASDTVDKSEFSILRNSIIQILTKLIKKYNNDNNKIIINKIIKKYFVENVMSILKHISQVIDISDKYLSIIKNNNENMNVCKCFDNIYTITFNGSCDNFTDIKNDIDSRMKNIYIALTSTFSKLQDIYFIKRFIEKDYVTEAITYTGADHSIMYIYALVKYFGFRIVDCYYFNKKLLKEPNLNELNNVILKTENEVYLSPYFYIKDIEKQCIEINPI